MLEKVLFSSLEPEIGWKFLNRPVEVSADVFAIKGRLLKVERSVESHGAIGDVLLENDGRRILIIGRSVVTVARRR